MWLNGSHILVMPSHDVTRHFGLCQLTFINGNRDKEFLASLRTGLGLAIKDWVKISY